MAQTHDQENDGLKCSCKLPQFHNEQYNFINYFVINEALLFVKLKISIDCRVLYTLCVQYLVFYVHVTCYIS